MDLKTASSTNRYEIVLDEGLAALERLVADLRGKTAQLNEAETRFYFIDRFLVECLGWPREVIRVESAHNNTFSDYELGIPRQLICEAKREGVSFDLPAGTSRALMQSIGALSKVCRPAHDAIVQAQQYCADRGAPYAVVSNSHQLIIFLGTRHDGIPPLKGQCIIIDGYDSMLANFGHIWQLISPAAVGQQRLSAALKGTQVIGIPRKLSTYLAYYPQFRYPSEAQHSLPFVPM